MFPSYKNHLLISSANQLTGFYIMGTLVVKWLNSKRNQSCHEQPWYIMMDLFGKIVKDYKPLTIFAKCSIADVWQVRKYASCSLSQKTVPKKDHKIHEKSSIKSLSVEQLHVWSYHIHFTVNVHKFFFSARGIFKTLPTAKTVQLFSQKSSIIDFCQGSKISLCVLLLNVSRWMLLSSWKLIYYL